MKKINIFVQIAVVFFVPVICFSAGSVTQYGITWTFDTDYTVGQFANGDYYVVDPGGGVSITNISNNFHNGLDLSTVDYDGSDVDCDWTSEITKPDHGLDNRSAYYSSDQNINKSLPYTLTGGKSLLSAISWQSGDAGIPADALSGRPYLKRIAILTCLSSSVGATAFRPSYAVGQKTIYYTTSLRSSLLPALSSPESANQETTAGYALWTQGPWTDLHSSWNSETLRPTDNYQSGTGTSASYNKHVVTKYGDAILGALLDSGDVGDKTQLIINLVQIGIDYYGLLQNGARWIADGGHQHGYKLPILFAGLMLNDSGMLSIGEDYLPDTRTFQDDNTFYISASDWHPTRTVCGDKTAEGGNNYVGDCESCATFYADRQYNSADHPNGTAEWGLRHWAMPCRDDSRIDAGYRSINASPLISHALAAQMLNLKTAWNNNSFFDYYDRWYTWSGSFDSAFASDMWDAYRAGAPYVFPGRGVSELNSGAIGISNINNGAIGVKIY
jgi:hypothetical protein